MSNDEAKKNFYKGNRHYEAGEYDLAIENYNRAIELNPGLAEAFKNLGVVYEKKGEFDLAIENYDRAIELNPDDAEAFYNRGGAYGRKGEYDKAIENYDQAIELSPEDAEAFNNRGGVYGRKGEYDKAIRDFNQAIELNPEGAAAYNNRGLAYDKKGDPVQAIEDFNRAIELNPEFATAFYNRGVTYRATGKENEAIQDFKKANELDPTVIPEKQVEEIREETAKVQDFQTILKKLRKEYKKGEMGWFLTSIVAVVGFLFLIFFHKTDYTTLSPFSVFPSIIIFIIIRQYTNAKQLRTEGSNRLAMAKMFEKIQENKDNPHYQDFIPKIIDSIAYSMYKNRTESTVQIIEELKSIFKK